MSIDEPLQRTQLFSDCVGVFQGGGCRAAAYSGAFAAAEERGVHFSELAGTSAGAIAAVFIAANASSAWLDDKLGTLDFPSLLSPVREGGATAILPGKRLRRWTSLFRDGAFYSGRGLERWIEQQLRELIKDASRPYVLFRDLPKPVTVVAADLLTGKPKIWSTDSTPNDPVARAVRASCSIPFFFDPVDTYVDGGLVSNLPTYSIAADSSDRRPVLAFALRDDGIHSNPSNLAERASAVIGTALQGAQEVQSALQPHINVVNINTGHIKATDFDTIELADLAKLRSEGYATTTAFLNRESVGSHPSEPTIRTTHAAETLDVLAQEFLLAQRSISIVMPTTDWVFELYSALLVACMKDIKVRVILPVYTGANEQMLYQRQSLAAIGCEVVEVPSERIEIIQAFLFDAEEDRRAAVVYSHGPSSVHASVLRGRNGDTAVLDLISAFLDDACADVTTSSRAGTPKLRAVVPGEVVDILKRVDQYSTCSVVIRDVELSKVDSWAKYAHLYKQRQQRAMAVMLRDYGLDPFVPFNVEYATGQQSLAVPPVVEASRDGRFTVVNGLSRLLLLHREGRTATICAVASDVQAPPPARSVTPLSVVPVKVGRRSQPEHRYDGFQQGNSRAVERVAHTLALLNGGATDGRKHT